MSRKDSFEFGSSKNKAPKEKPKREKSEGKKLFGDGGSFGGGSSFGKSSSFGGSSSFGKEKKEKPKKEKKEKISFGKAKESKASFGTGSEKKPLFGGLKREKSESFGGEKEKKPLFGKQKDSSFGSGEKKERKKLQWWHILIATVALIAIIAIIVAGVILEQINGMISDEEIEPPVIEGTVVSVGTFVPNDTQEYILCEYTEYFSGKQTLVWKKASEILFDYKPYYVLVSESGKPYYDYAYEYTSEITQEEAKQDLLSLIQRIFVYTDEEMLRFDVHVYEPVSFTRVVISSVVLDSDSNVTIKYSAGAVDGEMSEEFTLVGTYEKSDNDFSFTYTELPEDENLRRVAETLLGSAKYDYYAQYGQWVNKLSFGDYALYLSTYSDELSKI